MYKIIKIENNLIKVENVFPYETCNKILKIFKKENKWKLISQIRKGHYAHVFSSKSKLMPEKSETYIAKFYRNDKLSKNLYINKSLKKYIEPILRRLKIKHKLFDIRCHKFINANFLRSHYDGYAGTHAITINLNKQWKADWGGLLCVITGSKKEKIHALCPTWNTLNILSSNKKKSPHFVTNIESYAKEARYSITIFVK